MKKILSSTDSITKMDIINAEASQSFKDMPKDGEVGQFAYIFTPDGDVYGGNSATVYRACEGLIDLMADDPNGDFNVRVNSRPTNGGRDFLTLTVF